MKLGISIGYTGSEVKLPVDFVLEAERLGYDSVWTAEAYGSDAVTPLAYLAAKTSRIKFGTGIMQLAGRTPAMCAMTMSTLDALAGGGCVLVGLGLLVHFEHWENRVPGVFRFSNLIWCSG
ncbi:MAG: LLM class flavin-dependent oxidoreductase [Akkermansiaceae bacterium]|nr:LLM class flavin-dependent oxidoreductase [Akkermansiaceae bacterium]